MKIIIGPTYETCDRYRRMNNLDPKRVRIIHTGDTAVRTLAGMRIVKEDVVDLGRPDGKRDNEMIDQALRVAML